jgi:hypothetical protein
MSKRVGVLTAAAFAMTAGVSVVSAQFVSTLPAGGGNTYASQECGCAGGGGGSRVACFACCSNTKFEGGAFSVDPTNVRVCFSYCGLERRTNPCQQAFGTSSQLPQ